jgi:hypothetical protein
MFTAVFAASTPPLAVTIGGPFTFTQFLLSIVALVVVAVVAAAATTTANDGVTV